MYKQKIVQIVLYAVCLLSHGDMFSGQNYHYLYNLSNQVMISRALYVAADLELADYVGEGLSLEQLSEITSSHPLGLKRLIRCLVANGVFAWDEKGLICNNETSVFLKKNHAYTLRPFILHDDATRWNALGNLGYSVKTGNASFDELYGTDYFSYLQNNPVLSERFDQAMTIISQQEDNLIAQAINFAGVIADIGGGKGQLLQQIQEKCSNVEQLILFDLQQVQENVLFDNSLIQQVSGSFFDRINIKADTFILKRILHDWDDQRALCILCNVAQAMDDTSVLYIIDAVIDQCQDKQLILDIDLRLLSIFGGQERTQLEFEQLCVAAGLKIVKIQELTSISHVIECRKIQRA
jgi:hypothetical protein